MPSPDPGTPPPCRADTSLMGAVQLRLRCARCLDCCRVMRIVHGMHHTTAAATDGLGEGSGVGGGQHLFE